MFKRTGFKIMAAGMLFTTLLGFGMASDVFALQAKEPPPGAVQIVGPTVQGTATAMFIATVVRNTDGSIDKVATTGTMTSDVVAACREKEFVLGPIVNGLTISLADFEAAVSVAALQMTGLGYTAPAGCFSTFGGEWLDIDNVNKYSIRSYNFDFILNSAGEFQEELRALVVVKVGIGGYQ